MTATSVKLVIPRHYKKPVFLEPLRAVLSQEGTVNLECKVIFPSALYLSSFLPSISLQAACILIYFTVVCWYFDFCTIYPVPHMQGSIQEKKAE